jgi:CBS domain-containing protein
MLDKTKLHFVEADESGQSIGIITERDITRVLHYDIRKEFMIHHL